MDIDCIDWEAASQGDEYFIGTIVEEYVKLAYSIAHKWVRSSNIPTAEAIGRAEEALMKCIRRGTYNPSKSAFKSYLAMSVENELRMWARKKHKIEDMPSLEGCIIATADSGEEVSLLDVLEDTCEENCPEQSLDNLAELDEVVEVFYLTYQQLSHRETFCLFYFLQGQTQKDMAELLGLSQSYVSRIVKEALQKLRDCYYNLYRRC